MKTTKKSTRKAASKKAIAQKTTVKHRDPVVHFEMPAEEPKRMSKFYSSAFGWQSHMLGKDMNNYTVVTTAPEVDKVGRPKKRGIINGGFFVKSKDMPAQYPSVVIAVDDIAKTMKKITKAGGEVLGEPMDIPGFGKYVSFYDTEGNRVSVMEPTEQMKDKTKK